VTQRRPYSFVADRVVEVLEDHPRQIYSASSVREVLGTEYSKSSISQVLSRYCRLKNGVTRVGRDAYRYDGSHPPRQRRGGAWVVEPSRRYQTEEFIVKGGATHGRAVVVSPVLYDLGKGRWQCVVTSGAGLEGTVLYRAAHQLRPLRAARA
jgi:hypothetical protein